MFALIALVGLLSVLLVATVGVAYVSLPSGRMCPKCGGPTDPVALDGLRRIFARWLQWRWCSRCGWEGTGRNGPDVAPFEAPVDHDSGFRWGRPNASQVPIFWWGDDETTAPPEDAPPASGFQWAEAPGTDEEPDHPSGFRFKPREESEGPTFEWGETSGHPPKKAPWRSEPRGFQWKRPER